MKSAYRICKTVAIPGTKKTKKELPRIIKIRNTLAKLRVGYSFFIHRNEWKTARLPYSIVPRKEAKYEFGFKLKAKKYKNGVRIWRVA
jgi:hypothetical protein